MAFIAYSMGAASTLSASSKFSLPMYALGYVLLFLIEFCTVLASEYYDYETDRINQNFSMFTGGTRVLVEGRLGFRDIKIAITGALCLITVLGLLFVTVDRDVSPLLITVMLLIGLFFGFGLLRSEAYDRRIDNVMPLALSYIIWFGVIPLVSFL